MTEPDEKFITKDLTCPNPNCGKINRLAIIEKGHTLTERYRKLLIDSEYRIINEESSFVCQHCGQKIKAA